MIHRMTERRTTKRYKTITLVAIFSGALVAQTASPRPGAGSEANEAVTLLKAIRADAE